MVADGNPKLWTTREHRDSSHKCRQSVLWTKIDVLCGPRVVAADETGRFCWDLRSLEQQSTASGVRGSGWWSNLRRGGCWWSGGRSGWRRGFQGWRCWWNNSRQRLFHSLLLLLCRIQVYGLRIWLSGGSSPVGHIYSDA